MARFDRLVVDFGSVIHILEIGVRRRCTKFLPGEPSGLRRRGLVIGRQQPARIILWFHELSLILA
jgi:hypothetical protein